MQAVPTSCPRLVGPWPHRDNFWISGSLDLWISGSLDLWGRCCADVGFAIPGSPGRQIRSFPADRSAEGRRLLCWLHSLSSAACAVTVPGDQSEAGVRCHSKVRPFEDSRIPASFSTGKSVVVGGSATHAPRRLSWSACLPVCLSVPDAESSCRILGFWLEKGLSVCALDLLVCDPCILSQPADRTLCLSLPTSRPRDRAVRAVCGLREVFPVPG